MKDVNACVEKVDSGEQFASESVLRHEEVAMGIQHVGFAAWHCQQLQIVKLPPSVMSLEDGTFQRCYERCLKAHSMGAGIEQLCLPGDFYNIGPRRVKTAKDLWTSTSRAQKSQPCSTSPLPTAWL